MNPMGAVCSGAYSMTGNAIRWKVGTINGVYGYLRSFAAMNLMTTGLTVFAAGLAVWAT